MAQQDFSTLVERLHKREPRAPLSGAGDGMGHLKASKKGASSSSPPRPASKAPSNAPSANDGVNPGSPQLSATSPLAQLNSPESNKRMLAALEALEFEELQEAARYFEQTSAPGHEMLPRKEHERLFLERAAAEGREAAAKRFLSTLSRMAQSAAESSSQRRTGTAEHRRRLQAPLVAAAMARPQTPFARPPPPRWPGAVG